MAVPTRIDCLGVRGFPSQSTPDTRRPNSARFIPLANRSSDEGVLAHQVGTTTPRFDAGDSEHGALFLVECSSDDVPEGKLTSLPMAVHRRPGETVVFSWISRPSKQARGAGMKRVMADPPIEQAASAMPYDGKRMTLGGFAALVNEKGATAIAP